MMPLPFILLQFVGCSVAHLDAPEFGASPNQTQLQPARDPKVAPSRAVLYQST